MRFLISLIGFGLVLVGVYFLGQNIIFTTQISRFWWRDISATASVISLISGIISLFFFPSEIGDFGWVLVGLGIVLVFVSGSVILRQTSLWYFFLSFSAMAAGFRLIRNGRI